MTTTNAIRYSEQLADDLTTIAELFKQFHPSKGAIVFRGYRIVREPGGYRINELGGLDHDTGLANILWSDQLAVAIAVRNHVRSSKGGWARNVWELRTNLPGNPVLFASRFDLPKVGQILNLLEPKQAKPDHDSQRTGLFYRVKAFDITTFSIDLEDVSSEIGVIYEAGVRRADELGAP